MIRSLPYNQVDEWQTFNSLEAGGTTTTPGVPCPTGIQGVHNVNTCSPTSQVR